MLRGLLVVTTLLPDCATELRVDLLSVLKAVCRDGRSLLGHLPSVGVHNCATLQVFVELHVLFGFDLNRMLHLLDLKMVKLL